MIKVTHRLSTIKAHNKLTAPPLHQFQILTNLRRREKNIRKEKRAEMRQRRPIEEREKEERELCSEIASPLIIQLVDSSNQSPPQVDAVKGIPRLFRKNERNPHSNHHSVFLFGCSYLPIMSPSHP